MLEYIVQFVKNIFVTIWQYIYRDNAGFYVQIFVFINTVDGLHSLKIFLIVNCTNKSVMVC